MCPREVYGKLSPREPAVNSSHWIDGIRRILFLGCPQAFVSFETIRFTILHCSASLAKPEVGIGQAFCFQYLRTEFVQANQEPLALPEWIFQDLKVDF